MHSSDIEMNSIDPKKGGIHGVRLRSAQNAGGTEMLVRMPIINIPAWL
jgi:hypothetical protein